MRRSAAPSTLCGGKRMRFTSPSISQPRASSPPQLPLRGREEIQHIFSSSSTTPFSSPPSCRPPSGDSCRSGLPRFISPQSSSLRPVFKPPQLFKPPQRVSAVSGSSEPLQALENIQTPAPPKQAFAPKFAPKFSAKPAAPKPATSAPTTAPTSAPLSAASAESGAENEEGNRYFEAMWTKFSRKKHKTWEGDGVLIVGATSYELRDGDNKVVGKRGQCKRADIAGIGEGSTLSLGGKEVLVGDPLPAHKYTTGTFFISQALPAQSTAPSSKTFACPTKSGQSLTVNARKAVARHDPNAPGAIVLEGTAKDEVAVVIDPYLAYQLRPHQVEGVQFLYSSVMGFRGKGCGAVLADEMGLGKTLQCITLIWTLLKQGPDGSPLCRKALVVAPSSLVNNWKKEFKKWLGDERVKVWALTAGDSQLSDFIKSPLHSVLCISYEMFRKSVKEAVTVPWGLVVCDEGHRLKNNNAKIADALSKLPCKRRVILSGTPLQNNLKEFHALVDFVNPGVLGPSAVFKNVYADPIQLSQLPSASSSEKSLGKARSNELNTLTSQFILRRTSEVNEKYLPPKKEFVVFCAPHPVQRTVYSKLLENQALSAGQHLELICKLKKVCNHPSLVCTPETTQSKVRVAESGKLKVTAQLLQLYTGRGEKVVLVSNYTQTLDLLAHLCSTLSLSHHRLDGSTPQNKRNDLVEQFNSKHDSKLVFLLSSKAGGVGLNLIGGATLILYDIDWNPANDQQAMARVWRDGQKRTVNIYRLLTTGTIEEKIFQRQVRKCGLSSAVIERGSDECSFSEDELKDIFTLRTETTSSTHDLLECGCGGEYRYNNQALSAVSDPSDVPDPSAVSDPTAVSDPSPYYTVDSKKSQLLELMRWSHSHQLAELEHGPEVTFVLFKETLHK